jgi:hypothetical protein
MELPLFDDTLYCVDGYDIWLRVAYRRLLLNLKAA